MSPPGKEAATSDGFWRLPAATGSKHCEPNGYLTEAPEFCQAGGAVITAAPPACAMNPLDSLPVRVRQRLALNQLLGRDGYQTDLLKMVTGDVDTLALWKRPLDAEERATRNEAIFELWLGGETEQEIAQRGVTSPVHVHRIITSLRQTKLEHMEQTEKPPIYNVWNYSLCDPRFGQDHPGRIPGQAVLALLLWLTKPFDFVVDPMAGGGTTNDVCRYLLRRYRCFDIDPKRPDIGRWDVRQGFPHLPQKPALIFLDPPYWRLKRNEYSPDGAARGSYQEWLAFMKDLARDSFKTVRDGGHVALMVESFLDELERGRFLYLNSDCLALFQKAGFQGIQEISVNMPSQIKTFRDVEYAKRKGILLDLKRELYVFRKDARCPSTN